jgi:hypothetical protein
MTDTVRVPREPTEAMLEASNRAAMAFAGGDLSDADMTRLVWSAMLAASPQGEGSSADPAPIKPSADTGELRERVAELAWRFRGNERLGGPWYPSAKPTDSPAMSDCFGFADAILDLIQSERAG